MTANVSGPYAGPAPAHHTGVRVAIGLFGLAALVVGVVLIFDPVAAARSLALLVGLAFIIGGLLEVAVGWDGDHRVFSAVLGAILVVGGIVAILWPGVTLGTVALITGISLIAHGAGRIGIAVLERHEIPSWGWFVLAGAVNVVVGVLAIAWPQATVFVLALMLGVQIALFGLLLLAASFVHLGGPQPAPAV
jgi:uncharacterized membrane protein HdeD (DUF308 family)